MFDNRENKKNPKAPDFRCKDKTCKYQFNAQTGEYEPSQYGTGVWVPKIKKAQPPAVSAPNRATPVSNPNSNKGNNDSYKTMLLSYAKDIVVAEIAKGNVEHPFKRVADGYKALLTAYAFPFGKPKPQPEPEMGEIDMADFGE